jgi:hypothetical protein
MQGIADGKTYVEIDDRGAAQADVDTRESGASKAMIAYPAGRRRPAQGPARLAVQGRDPPGSTALELRLSTIGRIPASPPGSPSPAPTSWPPWLPPGWCTWATLGPDRQLRPAPPDETTATMIAGPNGPAIIA